VCLSISYQIKLTSVVQIFVTLYVLILKCSVLFQARSQTSGHANESRQETSEGGPERACSASQALIEMAVKTGLSLLFALLRQSWQQNTVPGIISVIVFLVLKCS
jgi:hypothetical protein